MEKIEHYQTVLKYVDMVDLKRQLGNEEMSTIEALQIAVEFTRKNFRAAAMEA